MRWVTIVWAMIGPACLMLTAVHLPALEPFGLKREIATVVGGFWREGCLRRLHGIARGQRCALPIVSLRIGSSPPYTQAFSPTQSTAIAAHLDTDCRCSVGTAAEGDGRRPALSAHPCT
jgi:hypothetical protein